MGAASRMESTGACGKIQVTEATAKLLIKSGKAHWLSPREDDVQVLQVNMVCACVHSPAIRFLTIATMYCHFRQRVREFCIHTGPILPTTTNPVWHQEPRVLLLKLHLRCITKHFCSMPMSVWSSGLWTSSLKTSKRL
jgi:hypothetical protein